MEAEFTFRTYAKRSSPQNWGAEGGQIIPLPSNAPRLVGVTIVILTPLYRCPLMHRWRTRRPWA